tara:strand:+ start:1951 stop:2796 length:846 start_codon:yes stop_codon:yes gene_type:complete
MMLNRQFEQFVFTAMLLTSYFFGSAVQAAADADLIVKNSQSLEQAAYLKLPSKILARDFHLLVKLPANYATAKQHYPTIYLLDGGATFPMLAGYYYYLQLEQLVPDAIIVGISYGTADFEQGNMRSTDYTAPSKERSYWGGAAKFQEVLIKEIFPAIESAYRSDNSKRIIFGQSLGGQFVLFSALTKPELFAGHIASNPALHRNLDFFIGSFYAKKPMTRLYVASGTQDDPRFRQPALTWMEHWQHQTNAPFLLRTGSLDGYGHFSIAPAAFKQGLISVLD